MTVAQAISSWTQISNTFAGSSTKLVSPAVEDSSSGQQWLASFMSQAKAANLTVDAIALHWYDISTPTDPAGAASQFLSRVDSYHNSYGLPVLITEFAIHDWSGSYPVSQMIAANQTFLNDVIPGLESRSYVAGYSWYNWFDDSALYTGNPMTPTAMGYSYIGAVSSGTTADISGLNLGEHVALSHRRHAHHDHQRRHLEIHQRPGPLEHDFRIARLGLEFVFRLGPHPDGATLHKAGRRSNLVRRRNARQRRSPRSGAGRDAGWRRDGRHRLDQYPQHRRLRPDRPPGSN